MAQNDRPFDFKKRHQVKNGAGSIERIFKIGDVPAMKMKLQVCPRGAAGNR